MLLGVTFLDFNKPLVISLEKENLALAVRSGYNADSMQLIMKTEIYRKCQVNRPLERVGGWISWNVDSVIKTKQDTHAKIDENRSRLFLIFL